MALDKVIEELWTATDYDGNRCELEKVNEYYQWTMVKSPWMVRPKIKLTRDQLINLHDAIREELGWRD